MRQGRQRLPGGRNGYLMWIKNMGCIGCHQLGNLATRTLPTSLANSTSSQEAWARRMQSGQAGGQMINIAQGPLARHPAQISRRLDRPHRGRRTTRAKARAPCGLRARRRCHSARLGGSAKLSARFIRHGPAAPDRQRQWPVVRRARNSAPTTFRCSIQSITSQPRSRRPCVTPIRRPLTTIRWWHHRHIGVRSEYGTARPWRTIPCLIVRAASGTRHAFARRTILPFARGVQRTLRPRYSPPSAPTASWRCTTPRAANTPSSTRALVPIICSLPRTRTTRYGRAAAMRSSAGSTRINSIRRAMRPHHRVGHRSCSTTMAMASSIAWTEPGQPADPAATASGGRLLCGHA